MRYLVAEFDVDSMPLEMHLASDYAGAGLILRRRGVPVGFVMVPSEGRSLIQLAAVRNKSWPKVNAASCDGFRLPPLTIAVCTHNRAESLRRCLEMLTRLEGADSGLEIIVVDNAPVDDRTAAVVNEFPGVRYVLERKLGLCAARNAAIRAATGDLIAFTDDDVVPDKRWLRGLRTALQENPGAAAFSGPVLPLELETEEQILMEGRGGLGHSFHKVLFTATLAGSPTYPCGEACFGAGANMAFRRKIFELIGLFDEVLGPATYTKAGDDLDIFYRIIRAGLTWAYEPEMAVFHEHRRDRKGFHRQVGTWGCSTVACLMKSYRNDPEYRGRIVRFLLRMMWRKLGGVAASALNARPYRWPVSLAWAEFKGALVGFTAYSRSLRQAQSQQRSSGAEAA